MLIGHIKPGISDYTATDISTTKFCDMSGVHLRGKIKQGKQTSFHNPSLDGSREKLFVPALLLSAHFHPTILIPNITQTFGVSKLSE